MSNDFDISRLQMVIFYLVVYGADCGCLVTLLSEDVSVASCSLLFEVSITKFKDSELENDFKGVRKMIKKLFPDLSIIHTVKFEDNFVYIKATDTCKMKVCAVVEM